MQLVAKIKQIIHTLWIYSICVLFSFTIIAGDTDAPAPPTDATSAMHSTQDIYNRLNTGAAGSKRTGGFSEPASAPGSTGNTLDEIMGIAPVADNVNGLTPAEVTYGKTFWGLRTDGTWGAQTGTSLPTISVQDLIILEGDGMSYPLSGSNFTVALSRPATQTVTVNYITADGTATAGSDYTSTTGTLTINIGEQFVTITVPVSPDKTFENNEVFSLTLSNPVNADLGRVVATATLLNDDGYTKIGSTGEPLTTVEAADDYAITPWDCIHDSATGLVWEIKANTAGLRYKSHTYSWYDTNSVSVGTQNGGACVDSDNCDTQKYIAAINAVGLCGHNDWRMPSVNELKSLTQGSNSPDIDIVYFPNNIASQYWSSETSSGNSTIAYTIYPFSGGLRDIWYKSEDWYVRLVRDVQ